MWIFCGCGSRHRRFRSSSLFFPPSLRSCWHSFAAAVVVVSFVAKAVLRLMSSQLRHLFYSSQWFRRNHPHPTPCQGPRRSGNIGEWRDETTRGGEADRHFCQYTKKERRRRQGGGVSLSRRCRYKDHSCHFAMTKLCPEFSVSLVHFVLPPSRSPSSRHLAFSLPRVRGRKLEFVSLSSSVAGSACISTFAILFVLPFLLPPFVLFPLP